LAALYARFSQGVNAFLVLEQGLSGDSATDAKLLSNYTLSTESACIFKGLREEFAGKAYDRSPTVGNNRPSNSPTFENRARVAVPATAATRPHAFLTSGLAIVMSCANNRDLVA
jgi:hypothetical protein